MTARPLQIIIHFFGYSAVLPFFSTNSLSKSNHEGPYFLIVAALAATAAAIPQLNVDNQQTSAMGGIGATALEQSGSANAGNYISAPPGKNVLALLSSIYLYCNP